MPLMIETRRVADLVLDPTNARKHPERNIETIRASLRHFGQRKPIVIDRHNVVVAGNGTLEAMRAEGWTQVDVTVFPGDANEARAFALTDNRSAELAGWDDDTLADVLRMIEPDTRVDLGWTDDELAALLGELEPQPEQTDPDYVPGVPAQAVTQKGDMWLLGSHRLICGDATESTVLSQLLGADPADLVWTDPPYGVGIVGGSHALPEAERLRRGGKTIENDALSEEATEQLWRSAVAAAVEMCRPGTVWYVAAPPGPLHLRFATVLQERGMLRQTLVWVKDQFVMGRSDYHYRHEPILYGWLPDAAHFFVDDRTQDTVWEIPRPQRSEEHPTMKPVELVERAVANSSSPHQIVLDPFAGSGTTLIACERLARRARLVEIDPLYCDVICRRFEEHTGQVPVLESTGEPHSFL